MKFYLAGLLCALVSCTSALTCPDLKPLNPSSVSSIAEDQKANLQFLGGFATGVVTPDALPELLGTLNSACFQDKVNIVASSIWLALKETKPIAELSWEYLLRSDLSPLPLQAYTGLTDCGRTTFQDWKMSMDALAVPKDSIVSHDGSVLFKYGGQNIDITADFEHMRSTWQAQEYCSAGHDLGTLAKRILHIIQGPSGIGACPSLGLDSGNVQEITALRMLGGFVHQLLGDGPVMNTLALPCFRENVNMFWEWSDFDGAVHVYFDKANSDDVIATGVRQLSATLLRASTAITQYCRKPPDLSRYISVAERLSKVDAEVVGSNRGTLWGLTTYYKTAEYCVSGRLLEELAISTPA